MKKFLRQCGLLAMTGLMVISGCRKKKEPTVTPQAQAPTITVPAPPQQPPPQPATTKPAPAPPSTAPQAGTPVKKSSTKKKRKPRTQVAKKTGGTETQPAPQPAQTATAAAPPSTATASAATTGAPTAAAAATPAGTSAPGPKTPDAPDTGTVDISAAVDHSQEARQRELTQQLLTSTDANLRGITRTLTADERAMVDEIRNYMAQSRAAITDGDLTRANNLATKAHLLSDELVKH